MLPLCHLNKLWTPPAADNLFNARHQELSDAVNIRDALESLCRPEGYTILDRWKLFTFSLLSERLFRYEVDEDNLRRLGRL